jgi:hypothetical protein
MEGQYVSLCQLRESRDPKSSELLTDTGSEGNE